MKFQYEGHTRTCSIIQYFLCLCFIAGAILYPAFAYPIDPSELQTVQLFYENDLFSGTDEYYTNAFQITWLSKDLGRYEDDNRLPKWSFPLLKAIPFSGNPASIHNIGVIFGQQLYTPSDTQTTTLLENDRPYAGFLYGGLALHSKTRSKLDTLEIVVGVVGPYAKGEATQNTVHDLRDIPTAKGWDNQLENELAIRLSWQRKWRLHSMELFDVLSYDLISQAGLTLGTVRTSTSAGGELRFGYNIPQDFGSDVIRAGAGVSAPIIKGAKSKETSLGAHVFISTQVEAVLHDIFLDGNTWRDSPSVQKKPLVADLSIGASVSIEMFKLTYRHLFKTEQFDTQKKGHTIGSLILAVSF